MTMPNLPAEGSTAWYSWAQGVDGRVRNTATESTPGVVEMADTTEGAAGTATNRAMSPARTSAAIAAAIAGIQQPNQTYVKGAIFQNANGTWPARSTVTSDSNRSVDWIGLVGNTTAPSIGGTGMGTRDFYEQRPTS